MGKQKGEAELIPQLAWAIISTISEFFCNVNLDDEGEPNIVHCQAQHLHKHAQGRTAAQPAQHAQAVTMEDLTKMHRLT